MNDELKTVKCKWCGIDTTMLETKECDGCWELRHRIEYFPEMAKRMLKELGLD